MLTTNQKKEIIAKLFERTGTLISEDDPAWLLVELNELYIEKSTEGFRKAFEESYSRLSEEREKHFSDIILVGNEILGRYYKVNQEIKETVKQMAEQTKAIPIPKPNNKEEKKANKVEANIYNKLIKFLSTLLSVAIIITVYELIKKLLEIQ